MSALTPYRLCDRCGRTELCESVRGGFLGEWPVVGLLCGRCMVGLGTGAAMWVRTTCIEQLRRTAGPGAA